MTEPDRTIPHAWRAPADPAEATAPEEALAEVEHGPHERATDPAQLDALRDLLAELSPAYDITKDEDDRRVRLVHKKTRETFTFWSYGSNAITHPETVAALRAYATGHS